MQDSRMIAEVVPPGVCDMLKVSGSRIATPFAPPRPGSTPMMTPRMMPTSISSTFLKLRATRKPPARACSSSISAKTSSSIQTQQRFERALGQRHLEPDLEDQEEHHAVTDADRQHLPPRVLAEPAHEERHEQRRREVDAEPGDQRDVDHRRHQHREHQLERRD